jgi:XXXCH domain-containing protein
MSKKGIAHRSETSTTALIDLLEDLVGGLRTGRVRLEAGEQTIVFHPDHPARLELAARQGDRESRLRLVLSGQTSKHRDDPADFSIQPFAGSPPVTVEPPAATISVSVEDAFTIDPPPGPTVVEDTAVTVGVAAVDSSPVPAVESGAAVIEAIEIEEIEITVETAPAEPDFEPVDMALVVETSPLDNGPPPATPVVYPADEPEPANPAAEPAPQKKTTTRPSTNSKRKSPAKGRSATRSKTSGQRKTGGAKGRGQAKSPAAADPELAYKKLKKKMTRNVNELTRRMADGGRPPIRLARSFYKSCLELMTWTSKVSGGRESFSAAAEAMMEAARTGDGHEFIRSLNRIKELRDDCHARHKPAAHPPK